MKQKLYLILAIGLYLGLSYTPGLRLIAFPIEILCTFLHEFGHAFFAWISGGTVHSLCVNMDGSGVTTTSGGNSSLLTMGGYVGSALFGNLMIRFSKDTRASIILKILGAIMLIASFLWYDNMVTTSAMVIYAIVLFVLSFVLPREILSFFLTFLGVASVIYIIQDFNVGPTSDLQAYESEVGIFPASVWMYIWLGIVLVMTTINIISVFKIKEKEQ